MTLFQGERTAQTCAKACLKQLCSTGRWRTVENQRDDPDDPLTMYIREISNVEPLTKEEETKLFRELGRSGDWDEQKELVARRLIETHLMLVLSIAQKRLGAGPPLLDLIQEGNIGLMNAIRSFAESPIGDFLPMPPLGSRTQSRRL
jgi:DNA-directed RNA polymerase sigma subunit (sigma70/sigma32)